MKILKVEVTNLLNRYSHIALDFNHDLNIITGKNGAGKTSLLKLLWYVISGNIELAMKEVPFKKFVVQTDEYICTINMIASNTCKIEVITNESTYSFEDIFYDEEEHTSVESAEEQANPLLQAIGSSVFFPTFRRIEGGFSIESGRAGNSVTRTLRAKSEIEEGLSTLSRRLTNSSHVFVSSISTVDIVGLLLRKHSDLSESYNDYQQETSQTIIKTIKEFERSGEEDSDRATSLLDEIRHRIESMEGEREQIMQPFETVRKVVELLFQHTGIKISNRLSFGDAATAVNSDALSAGEKQMLSFICYNTFYENSVVFIDEPELSLHVDWQRQLFTILQKQQSSNQFIIATHSPFIYSKYPDKELVLDSDRGNEGDEN
jgi:predicted ATPase